MSKGSEFLSFCSTYGSPGGLFALVSRPIGSPSLSGTGLLLPNGQLRLYLGRRSGAAPGFDPRQPAKAAALVLFDLRKAVASGLA